MAYSVLTGEARYWLTETDRQRLPRWAERWTAEVLSTAAMTAEDRAAARAAITRIYDAAALPPPAIVFVASPALGQVVTGFAAVLLSEEGAGDAAAAAVTDDVAAATFEAAWNRMSEALTGEVESATMREVVAATDEVVGEVAGRLDGAIELALSFAIDRAFGPTAVSGDPDPLVDAAISAVFAAIGKRANDDVLHGARALDAPPPEGWATALAEELGVADRLPHLRAAVGEAWRMRQGGNVDADQVAAMSFLTAVAPVDAPTLDVWREWEALATCSGQRWLHPRFCIVTERPRAIRFDAAGELHSESGAALRWADGSSLYAWHGVPLTADQSWMIERPSQITSAHIEAEPDATLRRVMCEISARVAPT